MTASVLALGATAARAGDFTYGYATINDPNAETYLVEKQHVRKVHEWTGVSYWGPNANDVQATLTYRFSFPAPTTEIFLHAGLTMFNYATEQSSRTDYGFTSLWASTDGTSWQQLLDGPTPAEVTTSNAVYHQSLPAALLGATNLWIQARMQQHDAMLAFHDSAATWTDAQFSRAHPEDTNEVFQLKARFGATVQATPLTPQTGRHWRIGLAVAAVLTGLGLLCLLLVCLGLLCVLVRRSGQQLASNAAVLRRLEEVLRRLDAERGATARSEPERRN